jgi:DNA-binding response OmpR family regulator
LRVLVVDGHEDCAEALAVPLRLDGHQVEVAHDGEDAMRRCQEMSPDLVLLDTALTGAEGGYAVASRLRRHPCAAAACLVAVTGLGTLEDRRRAWEVGFHFFLLKPVDPRELCELARAIAEA